MNNNVNEIIIVCDNAKYCNNNLKYAFNFVRFFEIDSHLSHLTPAWQIGKYHKQIEHFLINEYNFKLHMSD